MRVAKIISEKDGGMYEGINKGLRLATGDIVGLLHSDDVLYGSDTISQIVHEFVRTNAEFVYGNGIFVSPKDTNYVVRDWVSGGYEKGSIPRGWLPLHTTVYVKRDVFDKVGYYDESYKISADTDWLIRCLCKSSLKVSYLNDYVICMKMGGASTSFKQMKKKWSEDLHIYSSHGMRQYLSLSLKILSKVPQFVTAKFKHLFRRIKHRS